MWFCASWQLTMKTMWHCRSTSPCYSPSAATLASRSCESQGFRGSSSCWEQCMPKRIRKSMETFTACSLRCVHSAHVSYETERQKWKCICTYYFHAVAKMFHISYFKYFFYFTLHVMLPTGQILNVNVVFYFSHAEPSG